jgi:hypothetical protein
MDFLDEFAEGCLATGQVICVIAGIGLAGIGSFAWITIPIFTAIWPKLSTVDVDPGMVIPWIGIFVLHVGICAVALGIGIKYLRPIAKRQLERIKDAGTRET